jgi:hypothetical protein
MAEVKKHTHRAALAIFRHNDRKTKNPGNPEIDPTRTFNNVDLMPSPLRLNVNGKQAPKPTAAERYKKRLAELHTYGRADVKTLITWVITKPKGLPAEQEALFFRECYKFLTARYGGERNANTIQAVIHMDETTPHLHFAFIPAVEDKKRTGEKVCSSAVINRAELRAFHPALQEHLNNAGIKARVQTGITKRQGGNRSIKTMKMERERTVEYER